MSRNDFYLRDIHRYLPRYSIYYKSSKWVIIMGGAWVLKSFVKLYSYFNYFIPSMYSNVFNLGSISLEFSTPKPGNLPLLGRVMFHKCGARK